MEKNKSLALKVLRLIQENPSHWCQSVWHCGFTHGFAGFVELEVRSLPLSVPESECLTSPAFDPRRRDAIFRSIGLPPVERTVSTLVYAQHSLGISREDSAKLFNHENTFSDLETLVEVLFDD